MASCIFPSEATRRRVPRFAFPDCSPQLYGLDDELCRLMEQYAAYLHDTTGECWTLGELAQELTMRGLGEEDTWDFWAWIIKTEGQAEETYYLPRPSWPLSISGFDRDAAWTINQWARYCAAQGCPMTDGDAVRGMTFMMIDDDEGFRAWRSGRRQGPNGALLVSSN